jgi:hypothetical protein
MPDPSRSTLLRSVFVRSTIDEVAEAVSVATEHERQVYVERFGDQWRWSLVHGGGPYSLLRSPLGSSRWITRASSSGAGQSTVG